MDINQIIDILSHWAESKEEIEKLYVFGSRIKDDNKPDSDIDILLKLDETLIKDEIWNDLSGNELWLAWFKIAPIYRKELSELLPYKIDLNIDLGDSSPALQKYIKESSILIYLKGAQHDT
ncbi:MAG: nucleotidyltransferase domain-containing protein [Desulfobaccales bacterium]